MVLFEQDYCWTPRDAQHDVPFSFTCPDGATEVRLYFTFSPAGKPRRKSAVRRWKKRSHATTTVIPTNCSPCGQSSFSRSKT